MKSLSCGETGILLKLDIMEGKQANQRKDYVQLYGEGTAVTLRLTQEYYGSAWSSCSCRFCIFISEDTFGSAGKGMGMVKTAHKEYPLAYLTSWALGYENQ